jgi:hypothetical protein
MLSMAFQWQFWCESEPRLNEEPVPRAKPFNSDLCGDDADEVATGFMKWMMIEGHPGYKVGGVLQGYFPAWLWAPVAWGWQARLAESATQGVWHVCGRDTLLHRPLSRVLGSQCFMVAMSAGLLSVPIIVHQQNHPPLRCMNY